MTPGNGMDVRKIGAGWRKTCVTANNILGPRGQKKKKAPATIKRKRGAGSRTGKGAESEKSDSSQDLRNYFIGSKERPVEVGNSPGSSRPATNTS